MNLTSDELEELERMRLLALGERACLGCHGATAQLGALAIDALPALMAMARENEESRKCARHNFDVAQDRLASVNRQTGIITELRADLLATRRALKRAQAAALRGQAKFLTHGDWGEIRPGKQSWWSECYQREIDRGARLLNHYAALFERQAGEMK
jgi:hypothetical protein